MPAQDVLEHTPPKLFVPRRGPVQVDPAFLDPIAVAREAVIFEDRPDLLLGRRIHPIGRRCDAEPDAEHREHQHCTGAHQAQAFPQRQMAGQNGSQHDDQNTQNHQGIEHGMLPIHGAIADDQVSPTRSSSIV